MSNRKEKTESAATEPQANKPTGRRQFVTGVATAGAAAILGGAALANNRPADVKSKIMSRIQSQLDEETQLSARYAKSLHAQYLKGATTIDDVNTLPTGSN